MVRLCESREITPQIYLFLLKYANFRKKQLRYLRIQKKCCTFAAQNFKTYTIRILFRCVNIQEGNAKAISSFSPLEGKYSSLPLREGQGGSKSPFKGEIEGVSEQGGSKSPFKGDLEGLGI